MPHFEIVLNSTHVSSVHFRPLWELGVLRRTIIIVPQARHTGAELVVMTYVYTARGVLLPPPTSPPAAKGQGSSRPLTLRIPSHTLAYHPQQVYTTFYIGQN